MISKYFKNANPTLIKLENELLKDTFSTTTADNIIQSRNINLDEVNQNGNTLLHICLKNNKYKAASWLIEQGVSLSLQNKNRISTMRIAVEKGNIPVIKSILKYANEDINQVDKNGRSLLQDAVILGNNEVAQLLIDNLIDVNITDNNNRNVVFDAIAYGDAKMIDDIITIENIDLNNVDTTGKTVLHDKKVLEDDNVAKKLLENGADPTIIDPDGSNFITHTALRGEDGEELLDVAIEQGCDLNSNVADKSSVLMEVMYAFTRVTDGELQRRDELKNVASKLLENGSDINVIDKNGETVLFDMIRKNDIEGCAFLLEKDVDVNQINKNHDTPLAVAILNGIYSLDVILLLLQYKADPTIRNKHSQTIPEVLNNIILHVHNNKEIKDSDIVDNIKVDGKYMLILKEIIFIKDFDFSYLDSTGNPLFFTPFVYGDMKTCKLYINSGLDINLKNRYGHNIFYEYVYKSFKTDIYFPEFRENLVFLLVNKADIKSVNKHGQTIYSKIALFHNCNLKLFRKLIEVTRHDYTSIDNMGRTIIHSCVWSNNVELLKLVYGVQRNIQNIADNFNILPITYAALLGYKDIIIEFLRRDTVITSGKEISKKTKEKFQPMLKNIDNLTDNIEDKNDLRKLEIFKAQVIKDLSF
ncbi:MAG: ankyrin repeat domain-containing protein [Campylobacterota bacterium]|nr:ankyrin repeat domain-containing protein [Campylobacterota bacterium]